MPPARIERDYETQLIVGAAVYLEGWVNVRARAIGKLDIHCARIRQLLTVECHGLWKPARIHVRW